MSIETKVCVYNTEPGFSRTLRERLTSISGVKVLTEVGDRTTLFDVLRRLNFDAVIANLDPQPEAVLEIMDTVSTMYPELGVVGVSEDSRSETIIAAMRAGCRQFVAKPLDVTDLAQALARIAVNRVSEAALGKQIAVMGSCGGAGTTSLACNLAIDLARITDQYTALVDLHLEFGDVCTTFDCDPHNTLADLCDPEIELDAELVKSAMTELPCKVALLGRPKSVEQAASVAPEQVAQCLHLLAGLYPAVVIDTPRTFDRIVLGALEQADCVLLVFQLNVLSIRNAIRCRRMLTSYGMPPERVHLVINRYHEKQNTISPKDVESTIGQEIFALIPNDYHVVSTALNHGHTLAADAPESPVRKAIDQMARRLLSPGQASASRLRPKNTGLLGRFFGSTAP